MPNGSWEGWYFSEELKFAMQHGYTITILKGYKFNKQYDVFKDYVDYFYNIKSNAKDKIEKAISKSLLNNLLGRFGLDIDKSKTELMSEDKFNEVIETKDVLGLNKLGDKLLVNYKNKVNKEICDELNVDFKNTVFNNIKNKQESENTFNDVSIAIASAVTSYARIHITKIKLDIVNKGDKIYYSDTDSIVTNKPLNPDLEGKEIGLFKLEHNIATGYFITSKTYYLKLTYGSEVIKAKGVSNHNLCEDDFMKLLKGLNVESSKTQATKDFTQGYVNINTRIIKLNGDAYTKRVKIYKDGHWVNTKPIIINPIKKK